MLFIEVAAILPPFLPAFAAALTIAPTLVSVCESFWLKMLLLNAGMNWLGSAWATNNNESMFQPALLFREAGISRFGERKI
jgi:hypothetical protein